jgi:hypothetical protein
MTYARNARKKMRAEDPSGYAKKAAKVRRARAKKK